MVLERWCAETKELVAPKPKSWFVRQKKVLGANSPSHETQSLLERIIALPHAQWQGDVEKYNLYVPLGKPKKTKHGAQRKARE